MKIRKYIPLLAAIIMSLNAVGQISKSYSLDLEGAKKIMETAKSYAKENNAPGGAIAIVDAGGHLILLERLDGTFAIASEVSIGKAKTAAVFGFPSKKLEDAIIKGRGSLVTVGQNMLRGGLPITYNGVTIGGIGVSGAASADQDVAIAEAGLQVGFLKE